MTAPLEFSRPLSIEGIIPDRPRRETVEADDAERAALARRFGLQSLDKLRAEMTILRLSDSKIVRIEGKIEGEAVQTCVVSLQGVPVEINAGFDSYFTEDGKEIFDEGDNFSIELEEEEGPDLVVHDGMLDLGELVAQYFSLELDPYPRAPGVSLAAQMTKLGGDTKNHPFDILKKLKTDKDE